MKFIAKDLLAKRKPAAQFAKGINLAEHIRLSPAGGGQHVAEFIGTGDFASAFYERQRYEVDAGRAEEPLLYPALYTVVQDPSLPKEVTVYQLGPGGVVFSEIKEGGEVKFSTVSESSKTVPIVHYAAGLEYSKDLVVFNQQWTLGIFERAAGIAWNALLNHIHLYPIISATYTAANQTAADATGGTLEEKYLRTIEAGMTAASMDTTNPRRGPYDLLVSTSDLFMIERAMARRYQDGIDVQSSAIGRIQNVIAYDGTSLSRGKKSVTYPGVSAGKAYLVSKQYSAMDFLSFIKQDLEFMSGDGDISRFILEQVVGDAYLGVYANPTAAVEELTWPTS
mgnify:FL=1